MSVRLASLVAEGFKSFAGKVELNFSGNIIAIVGPNGAGKSNVCDAIAWVLGEQSPRSLRSQAMGEVIFVGSPQRQPAGAAQVTLVLKPKNGQPHDQIEISRRLLRDGTSEYRLQGKRVRLKDIAYKLAEIGIGTKAYAIIEQGRIAQVLSAKPTDRRALFEEAAGIGNFRLRRQEAELKLAETRANLARVEDIVAEVKRELTVIRRQARQAQKFAEIKEEARKLAQACAWLKLRQLQTQKEELEGRLKQARDAHAERLASLGRVEAELTETQRQWEQAGFFLSQLQEEEKKLALAGQRLEVEEAALRRELHGLRTREEQDRQQLTQVQQQLAEETAGEEELTTKLELAQREAEELSHLHQQAQAQAEARAKLAQEKERQAEEARSTLLRLVAAAADARNCFHRLQMAKEQIAYQKERLQGEKARLENHLQQLAKEEGEAAAAESACQKALQSVQEEEKILHQALEEKRERLFELKRALDELEHTLWQVHHELEAVQRTRAQLRALPESLTAVLEDRLMAGTVADYLKPGPELARLLDEAYGDLLLLPVVEGEEAVRKLLQSPPKSDTLEVAIRKPGQPGRTHPLLAAAGAEETEKGWLSALLPPVQQVANAEEAERLAENPDLLLLIPPRALRQGPRLRLGDGKKAVMGALQLRNREEELTTRKAELKTHREMLAAKLASLSQEVSEDERQLLSLHQRVRKATEALAEASSRHQARHRERLRLEREMEAFSLEGEQLQEEEARNQRELADAEVTAKKLEERAAEAESLVDQQTAAATSSRQEAAQARTKAEQLKSNALLASARAQHLARELTRHQQIQQQLTAQAERLSQDIEKLQSQQLQAADHLNEIRAQLEQNLGQSQLLAGEIAQAQEAAEHTKRSLIVKQEAATATRRQVQEAQEAVFSLELSLAELSGHLAQALEAAGDSPSEELPPEEALPELMARQKELEEKLSSLGPVNELAVAQEEELAQRFRFLSEQEADLKRSLASLQRSLKELDATCQERFLATLEEANRHFGEIFRELFGGGEAYVALSDPDSPLDAGIEVRVMPPGKRTQSVLLLSGGEKSLAAVALLLALFRIRPAPFCVLDEADAALDDVNVERLCQHLQAQAETTQFLLITHNRRTMAYADVLFGVTMEEPGVSRVVSVRLEEP